MPFLGLANDDAGGTSGCSDDTGAEELRVSGTADSLAAVKQSVFALAGFSLVYLHSGETGEDADADGTGADSGADIDGLVGESDTDE